MCYDLAYYTEGQRLYKDWLVYITMLHASIYFVIYKMTPFLTGTEERAHRTD